MKPFLRKQKFRLGQVEQREDGCWCDEQHLCEGVGVGVGAGVVVVVVGDAGVGASVTSNTCGKVGTAAPASPEPLSPSCHPWNAPEPSSLFISYQSQRELIQLNPWNVPKPLSLQR